MYDLEKEETIQWMRSVTGVIRGFILPLLHEEQEIKTIEVFCRIINQMLDDYIVKIRNNKNIEGEK